MKIAQIKKIYENMPYWMVAPVSPLIRMCLTKNRTFRETWDQLARWEEMTDSEKESLQTRKMREMLLHAQKYCPYYRRLFESCGFQPETYTSKEDLKKIPLLTRTMLRENIGEITAEDIKDCYKVTTGGSTGEPLALQMEKDAIYREWAFVYYYWAKFGYHFETDRVATFRAVDLKKKMTQINPLYGEIRMNPYLLNKDTVSVYHRKIKEYGACFLYGYPSLLYNFCRLAEKAGCNLKGQYRAVFLISENLYTFQEKMIRRVLDCPIAMFYGHTERAVFAEKTGEGYIFHPLYGQVELDHNIPVVTGLINEKVPLIRYALDDWFEQREDGTWNIEGHRNSDCLIGKNGEQFRASMLDFHGQLSERLGTFQLEQTEPGKVYLCLQSGETEEKAAEKVISDCEAKLGGGFDLQLKIVEHLQVTARGKYRFLVQHISE